MDYASLSGSVPLKNYISVDINTCCERILNNLHQNFWVSIHHLTFTTQMNFQLEIRFLQYFSPCSNSSQMDYNFPAVFRLFPNFQHIHEFLISDMKKFGWFAFSIRFVWFALRNLELSSYALVETLQTSLIRSCTSPRQTINESFKAHHELLLILSMGIAQSSEGGGKS